MRVAELGPRHLTWILLAAACAVGCGGGPSEPPPFRNVEANVDYVGSTACASCHEDQYEGYQSHGMANSYFGLTPENVVEDFPGPLIVDPTGGFEYRAVRDGDRFYQVETLRDGSGDVIHELRREMKQVMGSGTAARTYFDESQGFLYELPLTWYTQEGRWDFSPGYRKANKRFDRLVPDRCMACHNSYPESVPFADGKYSRIPEGIGCERCHGPGALHVSERLAVPEPASKVDSTIVNPVHLGLERRLDVCQQCHLHTTVSLLKAGRGPFDFRPSHRLEDYVAMYAAPEPAGDEEIGVISHADRMKESACFIQTVASGRNFECTTCHDPHQGFRSLGPAYFNATCQGCHGSEALSEVEAHAPANANCIDCHMPKVESFEAPHSSFTDHRIRVVSSRDVGASRIAESRLDESDAGKRLVPYFDHADDAVYEGMAYVILGTQRGDAGLLRLGADLLDAQAESGDIHGEAHFLRGFARLDVDGPRAALPGLQAAVEADPDVPERLNALAQAYEALRYDASSIDDLYRRALQIQPARADIWVNFGRFLEATGRIDEALTAYARAAEEQPWLPEASYNLGTALARSGSPDDAIRALRAAARLDPKDPQIWGNMGAVFAQTGQPDSTLFAFRQAVALAPDNALALGNLGAFYLNQSRFQEAIVFLDRAVQADPDFADAIANRALAHLQLGERASARLYARRALDAQPGHQLASQILASLDS